MLMVHVNEQKAVDKMETASIIKCCCKFLFVMLTYSMWRQTIDYDTEKKRKEKWQDT